MHFVVRRLVTTFATVAVALIATDALGQTTESIVAGQDGTVDLSGGAVMASKVKSPGPGWLVAHKVADGKPGAVIGNAALEEGDNADVKVALDEAPASGDELILMLHYDTGQAGVYEFGTIAKEDGPVMADGAPVMQKVTIK